MPSSGNQCCGSVFASMGIRIQPFIFQWGYGSRLFRHKKLNFYMGWKGWKSGLFLNFGQFPCSWFRIWIQESQVKTDPCGSRSTTLPVVTVWYLQSSLRNIYKVEIKFIARLSVLRIRIRDPVPFWPLDPGSQTHTFESLVTVFWVKSFIFLWKLA